MKQFIMGVLFGNRDFFPDQLITEARADIETLFAELGIRGIWLGEQDSKLGSVEPYADARKCADLFQAHRREIDGLLVCLPNFGDEKGVADTLKFAELNVPVLCYGLRTDFLGRLFEGSAQLLAWADNLVELKTVCEIAAKALVIGSR